MDESSRYIKRKNPLQGSLPIPDTKTFARSDIFPKLTTRNCLSRQWEHLSTTSHGYAIAVHETWGTRSTSTRRRSKSKQPRTQIGDFFEGPEFALWRSCRLYNGPVKRFYLQLETPCTHFRHHLENEQRVRILLFLLLSLLPMMLPELRLLLLGKHHGPYQRLGL